MALDFVPYIARCHSCGRDSIVKVNAQDGRFEEKPCVHCGQTAGYDGLAPAGKGMSADIPASKTDKKHPKPADGKQPSRLERLIGGGK